VATLSYIDDEGEHNAPLERDEVVIGRGAVDVWVDVRVTSRHDVSRRHAALRRDPITGAYFLKDLSSFGTSVGGRRLREGEEVELRDGDRIELAGILAMVFHAPRSNAGAHASGAAAR
jgi:predicted component of type VI protein secretion system